MVSKMFSYLYTNHMHRIEEKIGYRIRFENIPQTWIDGWMTFDMERSWRRYGIKAEGVNYFTLGALKQGVSSRFIRSEKQYQSWLGAYLVVFKERRDLTLQDHFALAVADQKNWLRDFGDTDPSCKMSTKKVGRTEEIKIGAYKAKLYEFLGGRSHSDVGRHSRNPTNRLLMSLMASMFNRCNPKLHLKGEQFLPHTPSGDYERIVLKGYTAIVDLDEKTKIVLYGNGAAIRHKDGRETDYTPLLKKDILKAFSKVEITKL